MNCLNRNIKSYSFEEGNANGKIRYMLTDVLNLCMDNWSQHLYLEDVHDYLIANNIDIKCVEGDYFITEADYQDDCLIDSAMAYGFHKANERLEEYERDLMALKSESYRW